MNNHTKIVIGLLIVLSLTLIVYVAILVRPRNQEPEVETEFVSEYVYGSNILEELVELIDELELETQEGASFYLAYYGEGDLKLSVSFSEFRNGEEVRHQLSIDPDDDGLIEFQTAYLELLGKTREDYNFER